MDVALKQRLVGATVLIALAVVVLPMLLGGRPKEAAHESQKIELPPQPAELDFQTRRYPIGEIPPAEARAAPPTAEPSPGAVAHVELEPSDFEDALPEAQSPAEPAADTRPDADVQRSVPEPAQAEPEPADVQSVAPQSAAGPPVGTVGGRYLVQVASFGSLANANRLSQTLRDHGYGVLSDTVKSDVGTLHRVRVGPFASEAAANRAVAGVRQQVDGVKPRVVDLQPELIAQVTAPVDPLVRWVLQVGSFSSAGNAEKLVERLRSDGLSAYSEAVSSTGSTIHRVRVGPYLERDEAIRVRGAVKERFSLDGVVMSAD